MTVASRACLRMASDASASRGQRCTGPKSEVKRNVDVGCEAAGRGHWCPVLVAAAEPTPWTRRCPLEQGTWLSMTAVSPVLAAHLEAVSQQEKPVTSVRHGFRQTAHRVRSVLVQRGHGCFTMAWCSARVKGRRGQRLSDSGTQGFVRISILPVPCCCGGCGWVDQANAKAILGMSGREVWPTPGWPRPQPPIAPATGMALTAGGRNIMSISCTAWVPAHGPYIGLTSWRLQSGRIRRDCPRPGEDVHGLD